MKILITALNIIQLDYAVALAEGFVFGEPRRLPNVHAYLFPLSRPGWKTLGAAGFFSDGWGESVPRFCTGPAGDLIIDREHIDTMHIRHKGWSARIDRRSVEQPPVTGRGVGRREAAMRAWVTHKLGTTEIEIHEVIK